MAHLTKHIAARMSQRGISCEMIALARSFGEFEGDRLVLNPARLVSLLERLRVMERTTMKLIDKGGIVVVEDDDALITTFNLNSFDRRKARRGPVTRARRHRAYERGAGR